VLNTKGTRAFDGDNFDNDRLLFAARTCERWFHAWRFITVTGSEVIWLFSGPFRRTFWINPAGKHFPKRNELNLSVIYRNKCLTWCQMRPP